MRRFKLLVETAPEVLTSGHLGALSTAFKRKVEVTAGTADEFCARVKEAADVTDANAVVTVFDKE
jgi:hypothetical protein